MKSIVTVSMVLIASYYIVKRVRKKDREMIAQLERKIAFLETERMIHFRRMNAEGGQGWQKISNLKI